jgi:hypothetical protein
MNTSVGVEPTGLSSSVTKKYDPFSAGNCSSEKPPFQGKLGFLDLVNRKKSDDVTFRELSEHLFFDQDGAIGSRRLEDDFNLMTFSVDREEGFAKFPDHVQSAESDDFDMSLLGITPYDTHAQKIDDRTGSNALPRVSTTERTTGWDDRISGRVTPKMSWACSRVDEDDAPPSKVVSKNLNFIGNASIAKVTPEHDKSRRRESTGSGDSEKYFGSVNTHNSKKSETACPSKKKKKKDTVDGLAKSESNTKVDRSNGTQTTELIIEKVQTMRRLTTRLKCCDMFLETQQRKGVPLASTALSYNRGVISTVLVTVGQ